MGSWIPAYQKHTFYGIELQGPRILPMGSWIPRAESHEAGKKGNATLQNECFGGSSITDSTVVRKKGDLKGDEKKGRPPPPPTPPHLTTPSHSNSACHKDASHKECTSQASPDLRLCLEPRCRGCPSTRSGNLRSRSLARALQTCGADTSLTTSSHEPYQSQPPPFQSGAPQLSDHHIKAAM